VQLVGDKDHIEEGEDRKKVTDAQDAQASAIDIVVLEDQEHEEADRRQDEFPQEEQSLTVAQKVAHQWVHLLAPRVQEIERHQAVNDREGEEEHPKSERSRAVGVNEVRLAGFLSPALAAAPSTDPEDVPDAGWTASPVADHLWFLILVCLHTSPRFSRCR